MLTITIQGGREIARTVERMGDALHGARIQTVLQPGGDVFLEGIRRRAPRRTGRLLRSLRTRYYSRDEVLTVGRAPRGGGAAHLREFGHRLVRRGRVVGRVPAQPFIEPAYRAHEAEAAQRVLRALGAELDRAMR